MPGAKALWSPRPCRLVAKPPQYQGLKLLAVEFDSRAVPSATLAIEAPGWAHSCQELRDAIEAVRNEGNAVEYALKLVLRVLDAAQDEVLIGDQVTACSYSWRCMLVNQHRRSPWVMLNTAVTVGTNRKKFMVRTFLKYELNELWGTAKTEGLALSDLSTICERVGAAPKDVLNELSTRIAEGYLDGTRTYEFCDDVLNGLINAIVEVSMTDDMPEPAFSLYQAFDQGEWLRSDDPAETDTGRKYTKPAVIEIMRVLEG